MAATNKKHNKNQRNFRNYPTQRTRITQPTRARGLRKRVALYFAVSAVILSGSFMVVSAQSAPDKWYSRKNPDSSGQTLGASNTTAGSKGKNQSKLQAERNNRRSTNKSKNGSTTAKSATTATAQGAKTTTTAVAAGAQSASVKAAQAQGKPQVTVPTPVGAPATVPVGMHTDIVTTYFWAGEAADASNANISNTPSAWDDIWSTHYGGYDDPLHRNGWLPAAFTPKENAFYFALPYNDYDASGNRRPDAGKCTAITGVNAASTSWCKNAWIKVTKGSKTAYAQWEDVGPMNEDDSAYVFGTAKPKNTWDSKSGLDVSPAMRDYLGLQDVDKTSWTFVSAASVPAGPWKQTVTNSGVYWP